MDQNERDFHYQGKNSREEHGLNSVAWPSRPPNIIKYRHVVMGDGGSAPRLSDEFLNEYIPKNLSTSVLWKDVLACGMISEQRNNDYIREDIQFMNQCLPEAPSPAPAPEPGTPPTHNLQSSMVVEAKEVKNNPISCKKEGEKVIIIYMDNENNDKYTFDIVKDCEFWKRSGMYFQNDLEKCYDILMMAFTENNGYVKWEIKERNEKDIIINISCDVCDVFGFSVDMTLDAEEKYIDKLEKRVKELEEKVEKYDELEEKIRSLCEYITYKETIDDGDERTVGRRWRDQMGHDNSRDWDVPMEEPGSPKYNELSQTKSGYRKEIWKKVMEEKGWTI